MREEFQQTKKGDDLLKVNNLVVEYTSNKKVVHAVNNVSFEIKRGEAMGLVGESGCGKSTIAKAVLRILPDRGARIAGGSMEFEGMDLVNLPEKEMEHIRGEKISMVFQDPMTALNPVKRILDQISGVIRLHNPDLKKHEAEDRAIEMLRTVGITEDRVRDYPHQFSGGQQHRVVVAIGLACNPELLLITHNLGIVAETCDYVAVLYGGEIVEYGSRREIFKNPSHPYTIGLLNALPSIESKKKRLKPIEGIMPEPSDLPKGCKFHTRCPYATDICNDGPVPVVDLGGTHLCQCHNLEAVKAAVEKEESE